MGEGSKEKEAMRDLWALVPSRAHPRKDLRSPLPVSVGEAERFVEMANRVDRDRALGNAVVPVMAAFAFRRLIETMLI